MCENKGKTLNGEPFECVAMDVSHNLGMFGCQADSLTSLICLVLLQTF